MQKKTKMWLLGVFLISIGIYIITSIITTTEIISDFSQGMYPSALFFVAIYYGGILAIVSGVILVMLGGLPIPFTPYPKGQGFSGAI